MVLFVLVSEVMSRKSTCLLASALAGLAVSTCGAENLFITQAAQGADTGVDAANAHSASWFNTSGNWGAGANKISADDTVHLVGTISSGLTVQGSGSSGHPVTILFETGAKISAPAFTTGSGGAALYASGKTDITLDGANTGMIENADNGDGLGKAVISRGIDLNAGCNRWTIKNLIIRNIYVHVSGNTSHLDSRCIHNYDGSDFTVDHCTLNNAYYGIIASTNSGNISNFTASYNTISDCSTGMAPSLGNNGTSISGVQIHDNDITMGANWYDPGDFNHVDGIHCFGRSATTDAITGYKCYNNYIHGDCSTNSTAFIYLEDDVIDPLIYNNVLVSSTHVSANSMLDLKQISTTTNVMRVFNNTFVGLGNTNTGGGAIYVQSAASTTTLEARNNIFESVYVAFGLQVGQTATIIADNNLYNDVGIVAWNSSQKVTLANWQTALGGCPGTDRECSSLNVDPSLNRVYGLDPGSPAIGAGKNLSDYFTTDKNGISRPLSAAWNLGPYENPGMPNSLTVVPSP